MSNYNGDKCAWCIVLNWNGWQDTVECVRALKLQTHRALTILVVDNGSSDDSAARISAAAPDVQVLQTGKNFGFGAGNNCGIRYALDHGAEFVWLLNNDTIAPPDTLEQMLQRASDEQNVGAVGSVLRYMGDPDRVQAWGGGKVNLWLGSSHHFHGPARFGANTYLTAASLLIPRDILTSVGLLFEGSFMYHEDSDYSLRLVRAGKRLVVAEGTSVLHKEGASSTRLSAMKDKFIVASGLHFLLHYAPLPPVSMALFLCSKLINRLRRGHWANAVAVLSGVRMFWLERQRARRALPGD